MRRVGKAKEVEPIVQGQVPRVDKWGGVKDKE